MRNICLPAYSLTNFLQPKFGNVESVFESCVVNRFIMNVSPTKKSLKALTGLEKIALSAVVFPQLEKSEIELVAKLIDISLTSTHPEHQLTYTQCLRANQWLRANGYDVQESVMDRAELN